MRALIQRVSEARVEIDGGVAGAIDKGLLVFLAIQHQDSEDTADRLLAKVLQYRVFSDSEGKMNLNVRQAQGGLLIISQFTLAADTQKGLRPSFTSAAVPQQAKRLYDYFLSQAKLRGAETSMPVAAGRFAADMQVSLTNDGPVTFLLEVN